MKWVPSMAGAGGAASGSGAGLRASGAAPSAGSGWLSVGSLSASCASGAGLPSGDRAPGAALSTVSLAGDCRSLHPPSAQLSDRPTAIPDHVLSSLIWASRVVFCGAPASADDPRSLAMLYGGTMWPQMHRDQNERRRRPIGGRRALYAIVLCVGVSARAQVAVEAPAEPMPPAVTTEPATSAAPAPDVAADPEPVEDRCPIYCDAMAVRCPDVFLGNRATCLAACALYPAGTVDIEALRCRLPGQADATPIPQASPATDPDDPRVVAPADETWFDSHPQLADDTSVVPPGLGAVFLPSLELDNRAPIVRVERDRSAVADGKPGRRIILEPGRYTVRLGDGADDQQVRIAVRVVADRTTVVPVSWGALEIEVVNPSFVPFRGTYEVIDMASREVVDLGFGADELLGEQPRVWVLAPGIYKLVKPGGTYRDRSDFATVRVLPGEYSRFVLVMNPDTGDFEGAGLVDEPVSDGVGWTVDGIIGGDIALFSTDLTTSGTTEGLQLQLSGFLDLSASLHDENYRWITRLDVEESHLGEPGTDDFFSLQDRVFFHSIYIYQFVSWFGPYARVGVETAILPRQVVLDDGEALQDSDGTLISGPDTVRFADAFAPTTLIQGVGGNFQAWRSREVELGLRLGVGARQQLTNGLKVRLPTPGDPDAETADARDPPDRLVPVADRFIEGVEATAIGSARITRYVTVTTEFDALYPFDQQQPVIFSWRNQIGLRLASFASVTYRLNLLRNPTLTLVDEVQTEHTVQLRFSITLF